MPEFDIYLFFFIKNKKASTAMVISLHSVIWTKNYTDIIDDRTYGFLDFKNTYLYYKYFYLGYWITINL